MNYIKADILSNLSENNLSGKLIIIMHGCNCFHVMGAGIAARLKSAIPDVLNVDTETIRGDSTKLGMYSLVKANYENNNLFILNCYTQFNYGGSTRQVDYEALYKVLVNVKTMCEGLNVPFELRSPMIGCGLAGGEWSIIKPMFEHLLPFADIYYL